MDKINRSSGSTSLPRVQFSKPSSKGNNYSIKPPKQPRRRWLVIVAAIVALLVAGGAAVVWWYSDALMPRSNSDQHIRVTIESGETADSIGKKLQDEGVIKSAIAFQWYAQQSGALHQLKAGAYLLSPRQSVQEIANWLVEGRVDSYNLALIPGKNLFEIEKILVEAGFEAAEVKAALNKNYDHPLLKDKPADVNLEGYIFPDTYDVSPETTAEELVVRTFDTLYGLIQENNLIPVLQQRGLNLHQAVTLASMVQLEVSQPDDRRQVAQVFEKRLHEGIALGSDVTFKYAATLLGQEPSVTIDSPYNTRLHKGLPPGAVANFEFDSLMAAAHPAPGDYLYFVSGDDGKNYFSKTQAEHEDNVKKYCTTLCFGE